MSILDGKQGCACDCDICPEYPTCPIKAEDSELNKMAAEICVRLVEGSRFAVAVALLWAGSGCGIVERAPTTNFDDMITICGLAREQHLSVTEVARSLGIL